MLESKQKEKKSKLIAASKHQSKNRELKCVLGGNKCRTKNKRNQKILIEMIFRRKEYVKTESRNIKKCLIKKNI